MLAELLLCFFFLPLQTNIEMQSDYGLTFKQQHRGQVSLRDHCSWVRDFLNFFYYQNNSRDQKIPV